MLPLATAQRWMLAAVALAVPLSAWGAIYPTNTWLQVGPVALMLPLAYRLLRHWTVSNASAACMTGFVLLHLFAARWSYSFVPYEAWLGEGISAVFGSDRNNFDRLVHFLFGVLAMPPMVELGARHGGLSARMALAFALMFVLAVGGLYEIFEWSLTLSLAPEDAGAYNGEQGDMFDAQKDMALAGLGAVLTVPLVRRAGWWRGIAE
ncbi:DUF2238 domain-containing protein [Erythrobacter donghaensis]|uniref:DUF2238 domain-containing protein n=2 Tax=Erythrobacter donghaensis TaxID=267135 RepID=UPI000A4AB406|nr:DUF2238 domain-containing protein [Erythrobacter donghaensis]